MALVVEKRGRGVIGAVVERNGMQHSFLSFFHTVVSPPPPLSPVHFPFCGSQVSEAGEKKSRNRRPSLLQGENNSLFKKKKKISLRRALTTAVARLGG